MQIDAFFSDNAPSTQQECNQQAERTIGRRVRPAPVQGAASYTVVPADDAVESVVQFRAADYALDLQFLQYVEQTYGRFVPQHRDAGKLGKLHIYTMDNIRGISAYLARDQLFENNYHL